MNTEKHNHLYPAFHIRKWADCDGKIYDKDLKKEDKCRTIVYKKDFTKDYYYSLGKIDNALEQRLSIFEHDITPLINRIDAMKESVQLSKKELELVKLYCILCASRHENTCEVIKNDESNVYRSNNYLFGTFRNETQEEVVGVTSNILDEFERLRRIPDDLETDNETLNNQGGQFGSFFTTGLHVSIIRAQDPILLISDRFCILENTMDSDHLYSYIPISPRTALLLVKSKYFYNEEIFLATKHRFGEKYGGGISDGYLSDLFGAEVGDYERCLFCNYAQSATSNNVEKTNNSITIKIQILPKEIFRLFNSIYCEDGSKILFCDEEELAFALKHQLRCRNIALQ